MSETGKKDDKITDIADYALEMSVNGVTCVCNPFKVQTNTCNVCKLA